MREPDVSLLAADSALLLSRADKVQAAWNLQSPQTVTTRSLEVTSKQGSQKWNARLLVKWLFL